MVGLDEIKAMLRLKHQVLPQGLTTLFSIPHVYIHAHISKEDISETLE